MNKPFLSRSVLLALAAIAVVAGALAVSIGSTDAAGNSIVSPDTAGDLGEHTSMVLDGAGNPVVSYYDVTNGDLKLLHCGNAACTSGSSITTPDSSGNVGSYTSLALDGSGYPVVSYYAGTGGDLRVLHCNDANCAPGGDSIATADAVGNVGKNTSIALDVNGYPVVSYRDLSSLRLKVLRCNDANCAGGDDTVTTPDNVTSTGSSDALGSFTSLELDGAGNAVVAYYDDANHDLKFLRCGNAACSSGNTIATPESTGNVGLYASMELAAGDIPVIAHYNATSQDLKLVRCGNATCTSGNVVSTPDPGGRVGEYASMTLDAMGRPVVAYHDYDEGALVVLHCGNTTCLSGNSIATPDAVDTAGQYPSVAIDGAGNPAVAYYEESQGDLRLLRCSDANCTGAKPGTPTPSDPAGDFDGDTVANGADADDDGDGCPDTNELQTAAFSQTTGGLRSPKNPWDYFNPTLDGRNRVDDILRVVRQFGIDSAEAGYTPATDRTPIGPYGWSLGPPNGLQRVDDIINIVVQFGHDCP